MEDEELVFFAFAICWEEKSVTSILIVKVEWNTDNELIKK